MSAIVNVNGELADDRHAVVSVFDHGFLYGEGVYETLRTYHQRPFLLAQHLHRLRRSAGLMAMCAGRRLLAVPRRRENREVSILSLR